MGRAMSLGVAGGHFCHSRRCACPSLMGTCDLSEHSSLRTAKPGALPAFVHLCLTYVGLGDRGLGAGARAAHALHALHAAYAARATHAARRLALLARALLCARARTGAGAFSHWPSPSHPPRAMMEPSPRKFCVNSAYGFCPTATTAPPPTDMTVETADCC